MLTDSPNPRKYWSVLKTRLKKEGSELATNCSQLKMRVYSPRGFMGRRNLSATPQVSLSQKHSPPHKMPKTSVHLVQCGLLASKLVNYKEWKS